MCNAMLNNVSGGSKYSSLNASNKAELNEATIRVQPETSTPKPQVPCSASAYRRYHRPNYDVYNSDGVVIGPDT